ncbi:MAG: class I SAM-dependent methyltransferase [Patescibacteria group bacterium]
MSHTNVYRNSVVADNYEAMLEKRKGLCSFDTQYLEENIKKNDKILDLGCGTGRHVLKFCDMAKITGIDISEKMIKIAREKIKDKAKLIVGNILETKNLVNSKFNIVLMMYHTLGSIDSLEDRKKIFSQVYNLLKENGRLILHVHNRNHINNLKFLLKRTQGDRKITSGVLDGAVIHFFTKNEIKELAEKYNFKIEEIIYLKYPDEEKQITGWKRLFYTGGFIFKLKNIS